jgi:hypothetical protein
MTGLNCKVGDLAIIVKDDGGLENLGLIVKVEAKEGLVGWERYDHIQKRFTGKMVRLFTWNVTSLSGRLYYSNVDGLYTRQSGGIPDECLRPLLDDSEIEQKVGEETLVD